MTVSGPASTTSATVAGSTTTTVSRSAQSSVALNRSGDCAAWCAARPGRITVASAMLKTPSGNSMRRSA